ncbi:TetR/AcrR family transcriptional regulator [Frigoribacterium sp. CFBP 13605]|uniref:TetR/AcrR family transcriptional regulator n=1 Tax=Frigoribacterium sp. CFBP 13605 TaxID=2774034 RepID=UPI00190883C8|nr:TetR/AcrR family transcriptional regulator [Frigoribacterium sp. CFBP 13605]MBD8141826.1 TetR/AcrR family transcriptional regulator [Frigoribacterium sp. CFBP 13605]
MATTAGKTAQRRLRTRFELTAAARRLTAEHGLAGFTIEELCASVGISRRTFFNHFASKDDVVVGVALDDDDEALDGYSSSRRDPRLPPLSTVFDDLGALVVERVENVGLTRGQAAHFKAALDREPRLFGAMMRQGDEQRRRVVSAVAAHEGLDVGDPRIDVAVTLLTGLVQRAFERFFSAEGRDDERFDAVLADQLVIARELFAAAAPRGPASPPAPTHPADHDRKAL